jgi:hypothetical protein
LSEGYTERARQRKVRRPLLGLRAAGPAVEASITLLGTLFAFLALDDITTDNATTGSRPSSGCSSASGRGS